MKRRLEGADGLIPNVLFAEARNTLKLSVRRSAIRPETAPDDPSVLASSNRRRKYFPRLDSRQVSCLNNSKKNNSFKASYFYTGQKKESQPTNTLWGNKKEVEIILFVKLGASNVTLVEGTHINHAVRLHETAPTKGLVMDGGC